jgi:glycosyltransferase involved in cell wall biosynthesis
MKKKTVLCAIPCFNESYNLPALFADLERARLFEIADILFIDDHSTDGTAALISQRGYKVIRHTKNLGYGQAVQTGFAFALKGKYDAFMIFPGDHQRSAKDARHLIITHQQNDFDVVSGSKFHIYSNLHGPIRRRIGNRIYSKIAEYGWNSPIEDVLSGFKIYSVEQVAPFFQHLPRGYAFDICFSLYASRFGLRLKEIPVDCRYDAHTSKMKSVLWVSIKMLFHLMIHFVKQPFAHPSPAKYDLTKRPLAHKVTSASTPLTRSAAVTSTVVFKEAIEQKTRSPLTQQRDSNDLSF